MVTSSLAFSLGTVLSLLPPAVLRFRRPDTDRRDALYWAAIIVALTASGLWAGVQVEAAWRTSFAVALWVTVAATVGLFAVVGVVDREAWRLTPLLMPCLAILGVMATIWQHTPERPLAAEVPLAWLGAHILLAVTTYGLLTLAAVAGLAVAIQEGALKRKRPTALSRRLPAIGDTERLVGRLLVSSELVLLFGLASGMAAQYFITGSLIEPDHKTLLSFAAFAVIGVLIVLHRATGLRGRRAARIVLVAYLLLTLAYPGVKFVSDVLMRRPL